MDHVARRPIDFDLAPIKRALESNHTLQSALTEELEEISRKKIENRQSASRLTKELHLALEKPMPVGNNIPNNRKWSRTFFSHKDDCPEPNEDTCFRRELELKSFFFHLRPPWNKKESKALTDAAKKESKDAADDDYFENIATALSTVSGDMNQPSTALPRTADECRRRLATLEKKTSPISKAESVKIIEQAHAHEGKPNWEDIANSLPGRTAWECFFAYQSRLRPVQNQAWTVAEDELLFKYIAASGPQTAIDAWSTAPLMTYLLPNKTRDQILNRLNQSLVNPKFTHCKWDDQEERRLAILMKIYKDSPRAVYLASTHFARSTKSVLDKWQRALNPTYSSRPFTKEEDQRLLGVMRSTPGAISWKELSQAHFPDRHPQRLMNRWSELATDNDILRRTEHTTMRSRKKRKDPIPVCEEALPQSGGYVVRVSKISKT